MSTHGPTEFTLPRGTLPDGTPEPEVHPLVRFSVRNYVFSIGIFVMAVLVGLASTFRLGVELLPNFEVPVLAVSTASSGTFRTLPSASAMSALSRAPWRPVAAFATPAFTTSARTG